MGGAPEDDWPEGYELGETLARYGTTVVRRGRRGGRAVIVKTARIGIRNRRETAAALEREAAIALSIDHPALAAVLDVVRDEHRVALVFADHGGPRLDVVLDRVGRLPVEAAMAVGIALAGALATIHRAGHAHGLLRPALVELSERGHVYLHGVGQLPRGTERGRDELLELPQHMAPEMILGDEADAAADVFLFGLLLFECLTGEHPFAGDETGITQRIRHAPVPPLRRLAPAVPSEVDRIVRRCLQKRPRDRFEDLTVVQSALVAALRDRTSQPGDRLIAAALAEAGLADAVPAPQQRHLDRTAGPGPNLKRWAIGAGVAIAAAGISFVAFRATDGDGGAEASGPRGVVGRPSHLRVLAHPWAEIYLDGELVDVTPVGRPLEITPGRHEVVFRHPNAADEKRVVEIVPGQTIVLDVAMQIVRPEDAGASETDASAEDLSP